MRILRPRLAWCLFLCALMPQVYAADKPGLVSGPELGFPSVGRTLLSFIVVFGLAIGALWLLQRFKPKFGIASSSGSNVGVRLITNRQITRALSVHVVEVGGQRFMIVAAPQSTVVTPLSGQSEDA